MSRWQNVWFFYDRISNWVSPNDLSRLPRLLGEKFTNDSHRVIWTANIQIINPIELYGMIVVNYGKCKTYKARWSWTFLIRLLCRPICVSVSVSANVSPAFCALDFSACLLSDVNAYISSSSIYHYVEHQKSCPNGKFPYFSPCRWLLYLL